MFVSRTEAWKLAVSARRGLLIRLKRLHIYIWAVLLCPICAVLQGSSVFDVSNVCLLCLEEQSVMFIYYLCLYHAVSCVFSLMFRSSRMKCWWKNTCDDSGIFTGSFFFYFKAISLSHYLCILASLPVLRCAKWVLLTPASALEESKKERTGWWEGSFHYSLSLSGDLFKFTLDVIHRESGGVFLSLTLCVEVSVEDQEVTDSQGWKLAVQLIEVS